MRLTAAMAVSAIPLMCIPIRRSEAQALISADSLRSIVTQARHISTEVRRLYWLDSDAQASAKALVDDFAKHNTAPCEYPQGQPELCGSYEAERVRLSSRSLQLQKEMTALATSRKTLQSQFDALMTRLRTSTFASSLAAQRGPIVKCSGLSPVSNAVGCLLKIVSIPPLAGTDSAHR